MELNWQNRGSKTGLDQTSHKHAQTGNHN